MGVLHAIFITEVPGTDSIDENWRPRTDQILQKTRAIIIATRMWLNLPGGLSVPGGLNQSGFNPKHRHPSPHPEAFAQAGMMQNFPRYLRLYQSSVISGKKSDERLRLTDPPPDLRP